MQIYMLAALLFVLYGCIRAHLIRNDLHGKSLALTACLSLAISALVLPYYLKSEDLPIAIIQAIRSGLSGIAMGVNGDIPYELKLDEKTFRFYRFFLYALYIAGPIAGSLYLFTFSSTVRIALSCIGKKTVHVFSSLNERSILIGESIAKKKGSDILLFCNSENGSGELEDRARGINALLLKSGQEKIYLFAKKTYEFYQIDEKEDSIKMTAGLCECLLKKKNYDPNNVIVRVFSHEKQKELINNLDVRYGERICLRHVDEDSSLAIQALNLSKKTLLKKDCRVAVLGDSHEIKALLRDMLPLLVNPESKAFVVAAGPQLSKICGDLNADIHDYVDFEVYDRPYGKEEEVLKEADCVFVLYEEDERGFETAIRLKHHFSAMHEDLHYPEIYCRIKADDLHKLIKEEKIVLFGDQSKIFGYDELIHPELEKAAKRTHLSYMSAQYPSIMQEDEQKQKRVLEESGFYTLRNFESSFAEALALTYKQAYILSFKKEAAISDKAFIEDYLAKKENMQKMADAEHDRWCLYHLLRGWHKANRLQSKAIIEKYKGKKANDPDLYLHPALVKNNELADCEAMVNSLLEEYGTENRVHYLDADKDIIRNLTKILKMEDQ